MHHLFRSAAIAIVLLVAARASAQSVTFDFEDGTDQGWGTGFGDDASKSFTITNIGGSNRMFVPHAAAGFAQEAGIASGNTSSAFFKAMDAASNNEAGYNVSYDYYIDTSTFGAGAGTFFQLGSFVNTGSGYYAQNFPGTNKEVELNGTQLASGQVFSGHVSYNMAAAGYDIPSGQTFLRFGLIENGNGTSQSVYYDNITISPAPEPASLSLLGAGVLAMAMRRRRA